MKNDKLCKNHMAFAGYRAELFLAQNSEYLDAGFQFLNLSNLEYSQSGLCHYKKVHCQSAKVVSDPKLPLCKQMLHLLP